MRPLLLSAAALALLAMPALAQPDHSHRVGKASVAPQVQDRAQAQLQHGPQGGDHGGDRGRGPAPAAAPAAAPQAQAAPQNHGNGRDRGNRGTAQTAPAAAPGVPQNRGNWQGRPNGNPGNNFANRPDNNRPGNNRPGNSFSTNRGNGNPGYAGQRHDFSNFHDFHRSFNASRRFRGPSYRRPAGWYQHRWTFGEFLPAAFWARDYWLSDYTSYDLPPPPYGAVWVRVGSDALLIDEDSGEVITVEYGVFY